MTEYEIKVLELLESIKKQLNLIAHNTGYPERATKAQAEALARIRPR